MNKIYRNTTLGVALTFRIDYIPDRLVVVMTKVGLVAFQCKHNGLHARVRVAAVGQRE